jgi:hypothetical protein
MLLRAQTDNDSPEFVIASPGIVGAWRSYTRPHRWHTCRIATSSPHPSHNTPLIPRKDNFYYVIASPDVVGAWRSYTRLHRWHMCRIATASLLIHSQHHSRLAKTGSKPIVFARNGWYRRVGSVTLRSYTRLLRWHTCKILTSLPTATPIHRSSG